jgi:hypothetical protein
LEISSSSLKLRLALVDIEDLKPHEEVVDTVVAQLAEDIRRDGIVRDPLIVDQDQFVILDGMHRFNSLKRLGCRFAPCCLLDYMSPQVTVGSWFRVFMVEDGRSLAQGILSSMKFSYDTKQVELASSSLGPDTIILTRDGTEFSLRDSTSILAHCQAAVGIEKQMVKGGLKVTYLSEALAMQWLKSERVNYVIVLPAFTKEMIQNFGSEGVLLPHKVTRHIIPSRPMEIGVPLSLLTDRDISLQEADEKLDELLKRRRIERLPPGSVIDGRHYDEELIVFSQ